MLPLTARITARTAARALVASALGAASPLVLARLFSAALTFALPLVLVRLLEPAAFGLYKQFFLVATTLLLVGQLGLSQSLYYFLPRGGAARGGYVTQSLLLLWPLAATLGLLLWVAAPRIAGWMGSGGLVALRLPLALSAMLMLAAAPLEAALTSDGRIKGAALAYVLSDGIRAAALIAAARWGRLWLGPAAIFWAAAAVALLRVLALVLLLVRHVLPTARPARARLREQLRFAIPFAGASLFYVAQRSCAQYAVSARFDTATFPLFSIASFHLPIVDIVFTPIAEVLMVSLGRTIGKNAHACRSQWHDAVDKLASILFPAAAGAWLLGPTVLPLLFTHRYEGSVPLFMLATLEIPLCIMPVDAVLRAAGDTRFLFSWNALRVAVTLALVIGGIHLAGLTGAIVGGLVSEALSRLVMLLRSRRFLGRPALAELMHWPILGRIAVAAGAACIPAWAMRLLFAPGISMVIASVVVYGAAYLALRVAWSGGAVRACSGEAASAP